MPQQRGRRGIAKRIIGKYQLYHKRIAKLIRNVNTVQKVSDTLSARKRQSQNAVTARWGWFNREHVKRGQLLDNIVRFVVSCGLCMILKINTVKWFMLREDCM